MFSPNQFVTQFLTSTNFWLKQVLQTMWIRVGFEAANSHTTPIFFQEMNSVLQASASQKKTQATSQQASTDTLTMTVEGDTNPDSADKDDDEVSREELRQNNKIISIPSDDQDASNEAIKTSSSKTQICDDKVKKQPEHVDGQNEKSISTSLSPQDTQQDDDSSTVEALQIDLQVDSSVTVVAQDIEPGEEDGGILMKDTTLDQTADDDEFFDADF